MGQRQGEVEMKTTSNRRFWWVIALVLSLVWSGMPVVAQEAQEGEEAAEAEPEAAEGEVYSEVITVTAQKREQDPQDVPISLSVIDTEAVDVLTAGGADVRFLSARVPSLVMESSFGRAFPRFYIRGLGNTDFDLNASQPVSMVYDGVVLENPVVKGMPVFDMERIEVLRGPQGTLFGRNTPAGVVSFVSKQPTDELEGDVKASWGTYNTIEAQGVVSGPLSDTVSGRLSLLYQSRSDWVDNTFTGIDDDLEGYDNGAWRLQLKFDPDDKFTGLLNLHGWEIDGTARLFRANIIEPGTNRLVKGFDREKVSIDGLNSQDISSQGGMLQLDYDLGGATLTSVTGYETLDMTSRGDVDGGFGASFAPPFGPGFIPFFSETEDGIPDLTQVTEELRIASNPSDDELGWLAGFFYFDEDVDIFTKNYVSIAPGNPQDGEASQTQSTSAWALFGTLFYDLSDAWTLQGGLRYSDEDRDYATERPDPVSASQTPTIRPITRNLSDSFTSWDVSATWAASENVNWFARLATSYRAPSVQGRILFCNDFEFGLNPATNCVSVADEEEILSAEIGVKSRLIDNQLTLNVTGYQYEVDGQQIVAVGGEFNTATLLNADTTEGYGFEADIHWTPAPSWLTTVGLSYNSTEIQDPDLGVAPCGGGCTVTDPIVNGLAMVDGNSLPHAPEWIFNGIVDYRSALGDGLLVVSLDWAYHDEKSFFLYESKEFNADAFELGFRAGFAFSEAKYEVALFGRNLTDEEIVRGGIDFNNLTGYVNEPRILGVEFKVNF
jgi:iron complex outermembrane receptor protein